MRVVSRAGIDVFKGLYSADIPLGFRQFTARLRDSAPAGAAKGRRPLESCRLLKKAGENFFLRFAPFSLSCG